MCLFTFRPKPIVFLMDSDPGSGHLHPWLVGPGSSTRSAGLLALNQTFNRCQQPTRPRRGPHTLTFRGSRSGRELQVVPAAEAVGASVCVVIDVT